MYYRKKNNIEGAHPFLRQGRTYCAICSKRKNWVEVSVSSTVKNDSKYSFTCHNTIIEIGCSEFINNNRIYGPNTISFIVFNKELQDATPK